MFRWQNSELEKLLVHPRGPFWSKRPRSMEWPPHSGRPMKVPEVDRGCWCSSQTPDPVVGRAADVKVLIATDGSKEATTARRTANRLLGPIDRNLDLLCVAPKLRNKNRNRHGRDSYERRVLAEITQVLEQAKSHLPSNAGVINLLREIGSPSAAIVNRASDYDLTVIGSSSTEICLMQVAETPWIQLGLEKDWATYSEEDKANSEAGVLERELVREGGSLACTSSGPSMSASTFRKHPTR